MKFSTGMVSVALFGSSLPETQWIGASKWVPVCSPHEKLFQYHAGPPLVVARDLLDAKRPALAELGRQDDGGEPRLQRLGQVDDPDAARHQVGEEPGQGLRGFRSPGLGPGSRRGFFCNRAHNDSSRSTSFGFSRNRARSSSATAPG